MEPWSNVSKLQTSKPCAPSRLLKYLWVATSRLLGSASGREKGCFWPLPGRFAVFDAAFRIRFAGYRAIGRSSAKVRMRTRL